MQEHPTDLGHAEQSFIQASVVLREGERAARERLRHRIAEVQRAMGDTAAALDSYRLAQADPTNARAPRDLEWTQRRVAELQNALR